MAPTIKETLMNLNAPPRKRLGQNFLKVEKILSLEVKMGHIEPSDRILEIGPGLGFLTKKLLLTGAHVIAVEKDRILHEYLNNTLEKEFENLTLIRGDIMDISVENINKVISNPPYNLSSAITLRLQDMGIERAVLMYQDIFAERLVAKVGTKQYSKLSVMCQYYFDVDIIQWVPRSSFHPAPDVDSALVVLNRRATREKLLDENIFTDVVKAAFLHRRKKIENAFRCSGIPYLKYVSKELDPSFMTKRAENLSPGDYVTLANNIFQKKNTRKDELND